MNMLSPDGPVAQWIFQLWWVLIAGGVAVYVLTIGALAYAVLRRRKATDPAPENREGKGRNVAIATGLTALILTSLAFASYTTGRAIADSHAMEGIPVSVTGQQWWWEVYYPNPEPRLSVLTANEIHIPTGQKIKLDLRAVDVIHSFWVPNLAGKRDLIPSRVTMTWLQADKPGVYRGQCAEFCGYQHAHMGFLVIAHEPAKFQHWLENERKPAVESADPLAQRGKQVFLSQSCMFCHAIRGIPAFGSTGPDLTHVGSRQSLGALTMRNDQASLINWIRDSQHYKPGTRMPPIRVADDDLNALATYLESLK